MRFGRDLRSVVASSAMTGFAAVMGAAAPAVTPSSGPVVVLLLEAESAGPGKAGESGADWEVRELKGASGGKVLAGTAADHLRAARPILVTLPLPGAYRVWVRYHKPTPRTGGFYALFQDEFGEETAFHACDWFPRLNPETPYIPRRSEAGEQTGFIWESFEAGFERAHAGTLTIGGCMVGGGYQERAVDCVVVTNVPGLAVASLSP
jgi:hypothetical protein